MDVYNGADLWLLLPLIELWSRCRSKKESEHGIGRRLRFSRRLTSKLRGPESDSIKRKLLQWRKIVTCEWQFSLPAIATRGGTQPPRIADSPIYSGPSPPGGFTLSLRYITMIFAQTFENNSCGLTVFWCGSIRLKVDGTDPSSILCFAISQPLACLSARTPTSF